VETPRAGSILALVALLAAAASFTTAAGAGGDAERANGLNEKGLRLAQEGRLEDAVRAFEAALGAAPDDETIKRNLGRCEANFGVELLGKGDLVGAELATRRARDLLPTDAVVRLNLAACLDERGYPARAAVEIKKALELGPEIALAHDRMGTLHYRDGRIEDAVAEWEKAASLAPPDKSLVERLASAKASIAAEARLTRQTSAHFEIRFDMEKHAVLASKVLQALEEAHGVVGAELQHFGQETLVVVLLPTDEFQSLTGAHGWVAGLYDGRIRLPVKDAEQREAEVLARARHEYVHSVLAPLGKRAPSWLHEGLAQVFERRSVAQATQRVRASEALPFASLAQSFAGTKSGDTARRQYDTALAFVSWLRDGPRAAGFRAAMSALFDDKSLDDAFKAGYDAPLPDLYAAFQKSVPR
jgi:tetratricopeptide (TPR) repeat protein